MDKEDKPKNNGKILNFELFKGQRELDKDYPKFLGYAERVFEGKLTPESMLKRLYYTLRYLQGHINGLKLLCMCFCIPEAEQKRGYKLIADWLEEITSELRELYEDDNDKR